MCVSEGILVLAWVLKVLKGRICDFGFGWWENSLNNHSDSCTNVNPLKTTEQRYEFYGIGTISQ